MTYTLSRATPTDYPDISDVIFDAVRTGPSLYTETQRTAWVPERRSGAEWEARLDGQVIVVARDRTRAVGLMSLAPDGYIDFAFIRSEAQGTGLFRKLYDWIQDHAVTTGKTRLWVHASLMAEPAFAAAGFAVVEHEIVEIGDENFQRAMMEKLLVTSLSPSMERGQR
jgi:putative acetyltransferase